LTARGLARKDRAALRSVRSLLAAGFAALALAVAAAAEIDDPRVPRAIPETAPRAVVVADVADLQSAPTRESDVVSQALLGWNVRVLEERDGFARIATPDRYIGWIAREALAPAPPGAADAAGAAGGYATAGEIVEVTSPIAFLYRERSVTSFAPVRRAPLGVRLELTAPEPEEGYFLVRAPDGRELFVQTGDVRRRDAAAAAPRGTGEEVVATAMGLLGAPYQWGGLTALGVDCSGLVATVYRFHGVDLYRDADLQMDDPAMLEVERHQLAPGDLVFFGERSITHVGLYAGGGEFVSATTFTRPMVRRDRLDDPYWAPLFRGARRPR
jgi:cell wall-associated NlpC family hydrolase